MGVLVGFNPLHRLNGNPFCQKISHLILCQDDTCIELLPLLPLGATRLFQSLLYEGVALLKLEIFFSVLRLLHFLR